MWGTPDMEWDKDPPYGSRRTWGFGGLIEKIVVGSVVCADGWNALRNGEPGATVGFALCA